jgi:hypothetical protein
MDMSTKKLPLLFLIFIALSSQAIAGNECTIVSSEAVANAFAPKTINFAQADPSGTCSWMIDGSGPLSVQVLVQPSADDAKLLYDVFVNSDKELYVNPVEHEKIAEDSSLRLSDANADTTAAALLVLSNDKVVKVTYYPRDASELNKQTAEIVHGLGQLAAGNAGNADQQYGECEWLPEPDLDKLLGNKNRKVQRLGPNHCMAYAQPGNASLTVMTDTNTTSSSFANQKSGITKSCKTVQLPEYGKGTYAYYDCENPGNQVMSVEIYQHGVHLELSYGPAGRASTVQDLEAMKPLIQHVYTKLTKG